MAVHTRRPSDTEQALHAVFHVMSHLYASTVGLLMPEADAQAWKRLSSSTSARNRCKHHVMVREL